MIINILAKFIPEEAICPSVSITSNLSLGKKKRILKQGEE